jgi:hypothetical protein
MIHYVHLRGRRASLINESRCSTTLQIHRNKLRGFLQPRDPRNHRRAHPLLSLRCEGAAGAGSTAFPYSTYSIQLIGIYSGIY